MEMKYIFVLDSLLKTMSLDTLNNSKEQLSTILLDKSVELADIVALNEEFGKKDLIEEREILKLYIKRITARINQFNYQ